MPPVYLIHARKEQPLPRFHPNHSFKSSLTRWAFFYVFPFLIPGNILSLLAIHSVQLISFLQCIFSVPASVHLFNSFAFIMTFLNSFLVNFFFLTTSSFYSSMPPSQHINKDFLLSLQSQPPWVQIFSFPSVYLWVKKSVLFQISVLSTMFTSKGHK